MNKRIVSFLIIFLSVSLVVLRSSDFFKEKEKVHKITGIVLNKEKDKVLFKTSNGTYTFKSTDNFSIGDNIIVEYTGLLNTNRNIQDIKVVNTLQTSEETDSNNIPLSWLDNGIFKDYYVLAKKKLEELSLEEKINQLLLVKYSSKAKEDLEERAFSGFVFYENDFKDKTKEEVISNMDSLNEKSKIPLLMAVDEEGGEVVRVSSNKNLVSTPFLSPSELYQKGGFKEIEKDTINKSNILNSLKINVNLAPVVDVSNSDEDYIYERTLKEDTSKVSEFAKTVIKASKNTGVSYTLKHFPGYGNNEDTHTSSSTDMRSLELIKERDIPPFKEGIAAGAEAILVSHNIVNSIDSENPSSLSVKVHEMLRKDLQFSGIVISDDMEMKALSGIEDSITKAISSGNDLIIVGDYAKAFEEIKKSLEEKKISNNLIDRAVFRVLAWKYYKGLFFEKHK